MSDEVESLGRSHGEFINRAEASTSSPSSPDKIESAKTETASKPLSYKGSVSGLKGLLSSRIAEGFSQVVNGIDKVSEMVQAVSVNSANPVPTTQIPIEQIYPCPDQPRQVFEPKALEELSQTLKEIGQAQAITVRKTPQGYEIISGERRFRAAKLAGFKVLDCVVKEVSRTQGRLLALVENTQRQDLLPIEEAEFLKKVLQENKELSLEKLAKQLGSHKSTLSEKIQLCEIPEEYKQQLYSRGRFFTHRHWRIASRITDPQLLRSTMETALSEHLSVAELENSVKALGSQFIKARKRKKGSKNGVLELEGTASKWQGFLRCEGRIVKINSVTCDLDKLNSQDKKDLIQCLENLVFEIKKDTAAVSVSRPETHLIELLSLQKSSIEI